MKKQWYRWLLSFFVLLMYINASAQHGAPNFCKLGNIQAYDRASAKATANIPEEDFYDVQYVHLDLSMNNTSVTIQGVAITKAQVVATSMPVYVFELTDELKIDSVFINNIKSPFSREGDVVTVTLLSSFILGDTFSAKVYYGGTPQAGTVFFFQHALNQIVAEDWSSPVTYTLSEPYTSKGWWPCKQVLVDKINTADIWITVPDSLMAGSNGLLKNVTKLPNNKKRFEWHTEYPMAYYLLSVAVANYQDYSFNTTLPDGTVLPVQNYVYNRQGFLEEYKTSIDSTAQMLYYFSELFGKYPFHKEKYGHCMTPVFGGMEHQTMTTIGNFRSTLVAHELAHQWFGDNVTCASWQDIWLNEGFASYAEYLHAEKYWPEGRAKAYMQALHNRVIEDSTIGAASIYITGKDTVDPYRIFHTRLSYDKASAIIHSLRFVINNDDLFFNVLKQYQVVYKDGTATSAQFITLAEQVTGMDLSDFFDQWLYGAGHPNYSLRWNQLGNKLFLLLQQKTTVPEKTSLFKTPLELKVSTISGDTTIRIYNDSNAQLLEFVIGSTVAGVHIDPNNWLLNTVDMSVRDFSLGVNALTSNEIIVYPNPATNAWFIAGVQEQSKLYLTDISGRLLWSTELTNNYGAKVPAQNLMRGIYLLNILNADGRKSSVKLSKL